jgi:hypothetical protein
MRSIGLEWNDFPLENRTCFLIPAPHEKYEESGPANCDLLIGEASTTHGAAPMTCVNPSE